MAPDPVTLPPPRIPVRAVWMWPLGTLVVGGAAVVLSAVRYGATVSSLLLALSTAAALGLWLGLLGLLGAVLGRRVEGELARGRARIRAALLAVPGEIVVALLLTVVAWGLVQAASDFSAHNQPDFPAVAVQVWRGAAVLGLPVAALAAVWIGRFVSRRLAGFGWRDRVSKAAIGIWCLWAVGHMSTGGFNVYFGKGLAAGLVLVAALVAALWLPRNVEATRKTVAIHAAVALVVAALGVLGSRHMGARALLLHDSRITPPLADAAVAWLDADGDGELPRALGGSDCDDGESRVATWRPEVPGNGVDDNCRLGDAPARPEPGRPVPSRGSPPSIYLITIDTVRADHLARLGYGRNTMPALEALADRGRFFTRAYASSNYTTFSAVSLLSGQSPEYLIHDPEVLAVRRSKFTHWLPHRLGTYHGYETVAFRPPLVDIGKIDLEQYRFHRYYGLEAQDYVSANRGSTSKVLAGWVEDVLERETYAGPRFSWMHFMDPHGVHMAHPTFPGEREEDAYDNELLWVDQHLARVIAAIERKHGDDAIIVVTSDHGEEFGDRGEWGHGFTLHEEEIHVPLVVVGPGIPPGVETAPTSISGVVPMLLSLLGDPPGPEVSYPSVLTPGDAVVVGSPFFADEERLQVALVEQRHKIIWSRATDTVLVFDLEQDPEERRNLAASAPELTARLLGRLQQSLERLD